MSIAVHKALKSLNITEYLDGQDSAGGINISNTIEITTEMGEVLTISITLGGHGHRIGWEVDSRINTGSFGSLWLGVLTS